MIGFHGVRRLNTAFTPAVVETRVAAIQGGGEQPRFKGPRRGLSLLEVMLALAILGVSLATIGELMRIGSRSAESARDLTTAQILCETKINEVVTGLIAAVPTSAAPIVDVGSSNDWLYTIETQPVAGQTGLLAVRVLVQQNPDLVSRPASFALVRWIIDPNTQSATSPSTSTSQSGSTSAGSATSSG